MPMPGPILCILFMGTLFIMLPPMLLIMLFIMLFMPFMGLFMFMLGVDGRCMGKPGPGPEYPAVMLAIWLLYWPCISGLSGRRATAVAVAVAVAAATMAAVLRASPAPLPPIVPGPVMPPGPAMPVLPDMAGPGLFV